MKAILIVAFGFLLLIVAASMFMVGSSSANLRELKDVWYMPIIPGIGFILMGIRMAVRDMGNSGGA